jgi:hypothetical protein
MGSFRHFLTSRPACPARPKVDPTYLTSVLRAVLHKPAPAGATTGIGGEKTPNFFRFFPARALRETASTRGSVIPLNHLFDTPGGSYDPIEDLDERKQS